MIREINTLKNHFDLVAVGKSPPIESQVKFISSETVFTIFERAIGMFYRFVTLNRGVITKYLSVQVRINRLLREIEPTIIIVHDPFYLQYLFSRKQKTKVIFNAHEYHPKEQEADLIWMRTWGEAYFKTYQKYLPKLALLINVNQEIADQCENEFGVKSLVIPNASQYNQAPKESWHYRKPLRFIHHGIPNPDRKLEVMIEAFRLLGKSFELDLMLVNNESEYYNFLKKEMANLSNVNLIPSVSFGEIIPFISQYDLGVYSLAPVSFNNRMALPNKFFEFIQARLPMIIGPSPVMSRYVLNYQIGKVADDFGAESLAAAIRSLSEEDVNNFRLNLEVAARELSMEHFESELLKKVKEISE